MPVNPVTVVMVGPKGAGKTSILSVMLHDVQQFTERLAQSSPDFADLRFRPALEPEGLAHAALHDGFASLRNLVSAAQRDGKTNSVNMDEGKILGDRTTRLTPVLFRMGRTPGKHEIRIDFHDFPGGFYSQTILDKNAEDGFVLFPQEDIVAWEKTIRSADVILVTVDASAQLGENPFLDESVYRYNSRITQLVEESVRHSPTTVIFVPVKCEHRTLEASFSPLFDDIALNMSPRNCHDLQEDVERLFPDLLAFLRSPDARSRSQAIFAPMVTVGGIRCSGRQYDPVRHRGTIRFSPILSEHYRYTPFKPMNCDKVFALCLLCAYRALDREWQENASIWERIVAFFGKTPFAAFTEKLTQAVHRADMEAAVFDPEALPPPDGCVALTPLWDPANPPAPEA